MLRAALNAVLDGYRSSRRMSDDTELALLVAVAPQIENDLIREEQRSRLSKAIDGLKPAYRAVFKLLTEQELSIEQIAAVLGLKKATVYGRYQRGVKMLRKKLGVR
jgi:RNA polymerase sigma factor (sigma-70 family)